jgi:toxin CptA
MGIAVSLPVHPSRRLRWLQAGLAASAVGAPLAGWPPELPLNLSPNQLLSLLLPWLAPLMGLLALCHPPRSLRNGKGFRIDISDNGAIRVAVYLNHGLDAAMQPAWLQPGAVLWPWLLVLPLRLADGRTLRLLVLHDSVAPGAFRPLSVACRACAARDL